MKLGETLQVVSFEIGVGCNLADIHPQCPVSLGVRRYAHLPSDRPMDTADIVLTMRALYDDYGFRGWFNFSHYNEPLLLRHRLLRLAKDASMVAPDCPRMVITNGTLFPLDVSPFAIFTAVHITDYGHQRLTDLVGLLEQHTTVVVNKGRLDGRMRGPGSNRAFKGCLYPFNDLAIDAFGNLRLCCFDWEGLASPGNIFRDGLAGSLAQWAATVRQIARSPMGAEAPAVCKTCRHSRFQTLGRTHLPARQAAKAWLKESAT